MVAHIVGEKGLAKRVGADEEETGTRTTRTTQFSDGAAVDEAARPRMTRRGSGAPTWGRGGDGCRPASGRRRRGCGAARRRGDGVGSGCCTPDPDPFVGGGEERHAGVGVRGEWVAARVAGG